METKKKIRSGLFPELNMWVSVCDSGSLLLRWSQPVWALSQSCLTELTENWISNTVVWIVKFAVEEDQDGALGAPTLQVQRSDNTVPGPHKLGPVCDVVQNPLCELEHPRQASVRSTGRKVVIAMET